MSNYNTEKDIFGFIYLIMNSVNRKKYVGLTTRSVELRFEEHCVQDSYIGRAIRKHGRDNFSVHIIDTAQSKVELVSKEEKWVYYYDSFGKEGYNLTNGGDGRVSKTKAEPLSDSEVRFLEFVDISIKKEGSKVATIKETLLTFVKMYLIARYKEDKEQAGTYIKSLNGLNRLMLGVVLLNVSEESKVKVPDGLIELI